MTVANEGQGPSVAFGEGRHPEVATRVSLGEWEGPLGLLLALIETRELDVLSVPLGALAEAYLDALATAPADRIGNISTFVSIAAQLILIKSRALLPHPPTEPAAVPPEETGDSEELLRARLLLYRAFRDAGAGLAALAAERVGLFTRDPSSARDAARAGAHPDAGDSVYPALLVAALDGLARLTPSAALPPEVVPRIISLAGRADILRSAIRDAGSIVLQELLRGVRDRVVVAVTFLALLELMKQREIVVEQSEPFGPIVARPAGAPGASVA